MSKKCPNCGACPECGARTPYSTLPPYYVPPYYPYWQQTGLPNYRYPMVTCQTTGSGTYTAKTTS